MSNNPRKRAAASSLFESTTPHKSKKASSLDSTPPADGSISSSAPPRRVSLVATSFSRTNDDVHSSIDLCPVTKALLDSRPLQRLRGVQQLATAQYVYVNCTHNRLEHSLGVAHLAERLAERIAQRQPHLVTTGKDILCVKLAGLLHDIGHGPFSHTYEDFLKKELPEHLQRHAELQQQYEGVPDIPEDYQHESTSLKLIDAALKSRGLKINLDKLDEPLQEIEGGSYPIAAESMRVFDQKNPLILTSRDFVFIKECINGKPIAAINRQVGVPPHQFVGRPRPHQEWLYDIVSNRHSGLDVDKIDYYARDHRAAMKGSGETDKVMILEAVVAWGDCTNPDKCERCKNPHSHVVGEAPKNAGQHLMICYPKKVVGAAMNFFKQRQHLHKTIYRHHKIDAVGHMVCDILCHADPFFRLTTVGGGQPLPISRAMLNVEAFLRLRDSILDMIANTDDPRLQKAHELIQRLEEGKFYKCVAEQSINGSNQHLWNEQTSGEVRAAEIKQELVKVKGFYEKGTRLTADDIIVDCLKIHCGRGKNNPLSRMRFLPKEQLSKLDAEKIEDLPEAKEVDETSYEAIIPRVFCERSVRIFCRTPDKTDLAQHIFSQWLDEQRVKNCQTTPPPKEARRRFSETKMISPGPMLEDEEEKKD